MAKDLNENFTTASAKAVSEGSGVHDAYALGETILTQQEVLINFKVA